MYGTLWFSMVEYFVDLHELKKLLSKYLVWLNSHSIQQIIPYWMHGDKLTQLNLNGELCLELNRCSQLQ